MDVQLCVTTSTGFVYHTNTIFRDCAISIYRTILPANLIQLGIQRYDVILDMDWLAKHKVTIDCEKKLISFSNLEGVRSVLRGSSFQKSTPIIFATRAWKLLKRGCYGYLCAVDVALSQGLEVRDIPIATEFPKCSK